MTSLELDEHDNGELALLVGDVVGDSHDEPRADKICRSKKPPNKKKREGTTLRKAPQAPKRFKSSYICFFMAKQPEIKGELGEKATVTEISKRSAQLWKVLPADERAHWDEVAAKDKQRYMMEKAAYTGPWQVPWKRAKKDPSAPKRPMSAFLYFSQGRRRQIKDANPTLKNTEVSRLLGEMWRKAPEEERRPHIEQEKGQREKYKVAIADWRKDDEARQEKERKAQADQAAYMANMYSSNPNGEHPQYPPYGGDPNMMNQYPGQQPNMGQPPPPPGSGYAYAGPPSPLASMHQYPGYSYPPVGNPYQFPTNGKQPVILGPSGTPRYSPPSNNSNNNYSGGPPPQYQEQQQQAPAPPPPHQYGGPPPPQGYELNQGHPHSHYEYPPPAEHGGAEHPPAPPPQYQQQQQHLHHHHQQE